MAWIVEAVIKSQDWPEQVLSFTNEKDAYQAASHLCEGLAQGQPLTIDHPGNIAEYYPANLVQKVRVRRVG